MNVQIFKPKTIKFTDKAANKVKSLIQEENEKFNLRVFVSGGGCSGFQYGFSFDNEIEEDDTVICNSDVNLVIDSMSLQYLTGSIIDYSEGLEGSKFIVNNPNAKTTCGCGSSFSI